MLYGSPRNPRIGKSVDTVGDCSGSCSGRGASFQGRATAAYPTNLAMRSFSARGPFRRKTVQRGSWVFPFAPLWYHKPLLYSCFEGTYSCQGILSGQPPNIARPRRTLSARLCSPSWLVTSPWPPRRVATRTPTTTRRWPPPSRRPRATPCPRTRSRPPSTRPSVPARTPPTPRPSSTRATARRVWPCSARR